MTKPESAVYDYLLGQNRPYSTNDITLNLHKEHGKTAVQKALDLLVADGKVTEKANGKQKAYVVNQADLPAPSAAELAAADAEIAKLTAEQQTVGERAREAESRQRTLTSAPLTADLVVRVAEREKEVKELEERVEFLQNNQGKVISKEEKVKVEKTRDASVKEWRKRKRICTGITDAILESYPKSKKILFEEVGIETDEEVGVKMPEIWN